MEWQSLVVGAANLLVGTGVGWVATYYFQPGDWARKQIQTGKWLSKYLSPATNEWVAREATVTRKLWGPIKIDEPGSRSADKISGRCLVGHWQSKQGVEEGEFVLRIVCRGRAMCGIWEGTGPVGDVLQAWILGVDADALAEAEAILHNTVSFPAHASGAGGKTG